MWGLNGWREPRETEGLNGKPSRRPRRRWTHRTVAVHHMLVDDPDDSGWLDRIFSAMTSATHS